MAREWALAWALARGLAREELHSKSSEGEQEQALALALALALDRPAQGPDRPGPAWTAPPAAKAPRAEPWG